MAKSDALQGSLELLVLKILARRAPLHGYAIMTSIEQISDDVLRVEEGSLYPALHRMEESGWIRAEWGTSEAGRKARVYSLTAAGRKQLAAEDLALDRQATPLVVVEQDALLAEQFPEHLVFGPLEVDGRLLTLIDPAGQDGEEQLPGL